MGKVKWDVNEIEALADEVAKLRIAYPEENLTPLILKAQKTVLPDGRRRSLASYKQCGPAFMKYLKVSIKEATAREPVKTESVIEYKEPDTDEAIINASTQELITELISRVLGMVDGLVSSGKSVDLVGKRVTALELREKIALGPSYPLIRIGVSGLNAAHFRALQNRIGPAVDMKFFQKERPQAPPTVEHVVVIGAAKRDWKDFASSKVLFCEQTSLGEVTNFVKKLIPNSVAG